MLSTPFTLARATTTYPRTQTTNSLPLPTPHTHTHTHTVQHLDHAVFNLDPEGLVVLPAFQYPRGVNFDDVLPSPSPPNARLVASPAANEHLICVAICPVLLFVDRREADGDIVLSLHSEPYRGGLDAAEMVVASFSTVFGVED